MSASHFEIQKAEWFGEAIVCPVVLGCVEETMRTQHFHHLPTETCHLEFAIAYLFLFDMVIVSELPDNGLRERILGACLDKMEPSLVQLANAGKLQFHEVYQAAYSEYSHAFEAVVRPQNQTQEQLDRCGLPPSPIPEFLNHSHPPLAQKPLFG